uniref:AAA+ ATPase domain-containing protein n=1 Tax=viral metagenome TaxID=1070528 RepID=A0A6C0JIH1_9ZZZZ
MNQQIVELLKTQMMLSSGGGAKSFIIVSLFERLVQSFPQWSGFLFAGCRRKQTKPENLPPPNKEISAEILFERNKEDKKSTPTFFQNRMDAVIHSVSKVHSIRHLLAITHHDYVPHEFDSISIDNDLYFQLLEIKHSEGTIEALKFKIFCYEHENMFLQNYVESCSTDYDRHMLNKLGTNKYFFNMMVQTKNRGIQNPLPTSYIMFTKHKFVTSRTFDNVFFEQRQHVRDHTEFFLKRKDWYDAKGIPHTLGFMFHGPPGCGKTSTIKAIANVGKRHIINIHLSEIKSKEQLTHLFFNDEINVLDNGKTERYIIPVNERMYVIEDIDAMGDIVLRRELKKPEVKKEIKMDEFGNIKEEETNPIDLSFLLNLLDGTLESNGRIIAISTNFPERIDSALIRPGRIDMIVNFKKCSAEIIHDMVCSFYDISSIVIDNAALNGKWSPAEVNQILFRNFKDINLALKELVELEPNDLYGFKKSA